MTAASLSVHPAYQTQRSIAASTAARARGDDGVPGVLARRPRGVGEEVALGVGDLVRAAGLRAREGAADVELVGLADGEPVVHADAPFRYAARPCRPPSR